MNKYILYINEENKILEYMLPGEDNRQGTIDLSYEMGVPNLIFSYEVWDGEWFFKSNDHIRISVEHQVQEDLQLYGGLRFNIKVRQSGKRLMGEVNCLEKSMTNFVKYDISSAQQITIGSSTDCTIRIDERFISSCHATIFRQGQDWFISDSSRNGTFVNSEKVVSSRKLHMGDSIYIVGYKILFFGRFIAVNRVDCIHISLTQVSKTQIQDEQKYKDNSVFSRAPRFIEPLEESEVEIENPPKKEKMKKTPLLFVLGPSITMPIPILMTVLFNAMVNKSASGLSYIGMLISVVMFALIGIMWSILRQRYDRKSKEEAELFRVNAYSQYISQNDAMLTEKQEHNRSVLEKTYKSSRELIRAFSINNFELWNRNINHTDFLTVRLGHGYIKSPVIVKVPKEKFSMEQDNLIALPGQLQQKYEYLPETVKTLNLRDNKIIGVIGNTKDVESVARNMIVQLAALHSYTDVKIAVLYGGDYDFEWAKWLPHVFSNDKKNRFIGNEENSVQNTIYVLTNELRGRAEKLGEEGTKTKLGSRYVVFCTDRHYFENETINKYISSDEDYGFTFVMLYETVNNLPNECNLILEKSSNFNGLYVLDEAYDSTRNISFDEVTNYEASDFARMISGYNVSEMVEGQLPDSVDYFEMIGISRLEEWDLIKMYKRNRSYEGLPSFVGLSAGGKPMYLDIHEKKYGPHGLVAGTTGSGKSETIQTFILSLAMNFSPDEIAFILIDYKGGGMANAFLKLPHLAGTITNLGTGEDAASSDTVDPNQMRRALISIRSEIKRRQTVFNQYKVNHIDLYMRLYREHKADEPMPHLVIISDEFAELKKEQPEFIKELVSTARVGRSLGIHLILATQKPAGVVDEEIWSNSRFKVCLRVQDKQDSHGMLKRPEAAYLTQTGRAYLQIGNDEIFEMFQSGYSGADYNPREEKASTAEAVDMIGLDGHSLVVKRSKNQSNERKQSQLEASVDYIHDVSMQNGIRNTRPLWLPIIPSKIYLEDIFRDYVIDYSTGLFAVLGLVDIPERQMIEPLTVNFQEISNMMIAGINSSGKTTMVKTIITSMLSCYSADFVQFYLLDFSSRTLKMFRQLPHVGDVFYPDESEGIKRTLKFAAEEIERRTAIFMKQGVGGFREYNETNPQNILPCLIFVIDNFYDFISDYAELEEEVLKLTRDGSRYGIQFVITVNRGSDMRYKLRQNFTYLVPLKQIEKSDYMELLGKTPSFMPTAITGRGLIMLDDILEFMTALPMKGETEAERTSNLRSYIEQYCKNYVGAKAKGVPIIPKNNTYTEILDNQAVDILDQEYLPVGYDEERIEIVSTGYKTDYAYTVWGGTKAATELVMSNLYEAAKRQREKLICVYGETKPNYISGVDACECFSGYDRLHELLVYLRGEFKQRSDYRKQLIEENKPHWPEEIGEKFGKIYAFISDLRDFAAEIYDEDNEEKLYPIMELFMKQGAGLGILFIVATTGEMSLQLMGYKLVKTILEYGTGICVGTKLSEQRLFSFDLPLSEQLKKLPDNSGCTMIGKRMARVYIPGNE